MDKWPAITFFDVNGGLVVWLLLILYTFLGIAIICDEHFVEALEAISASLKLSVLRRRRRCHIHGRRLLCP